VFDPGIQATSTTVYENEIPGGQYSNLYEQARKVGVSATEFFELTKRYQEVNKLFGNIVKVTPSSKVVGDMALLLQKHGITGDDFLKKKPKLDYPDSVISFFKGHMGIPYGGFPKDVRAMVLGDNPPPPEKLVAQEADSLEEVKLELSKKLSRPVTDQDALSYRLYPKVFLDFVYHREQYGRVDILPTQNFFYGLETNEEISVDIEPGKSLVISLRGISDADNKGQRTVFLDLNGYARPTKVRDLSLTATVATKPKANPADENHVPAAMPGKVIEIKTKAGSTVKEGDSLLVTESMKMEYAITAKKAGKVSKIHAQVGEMVEGGDLLIELE
jgi:pyruvate carboxylase